MDYAVGLPGGPVAETQARWSGWWIDLSAVSDKGSTMAHKKGQGSSRNGRDSNPQMRGIKLYGGQYAKAGSIIARQTGTKWHPGKNVGVGRDWTIFSLIEGMVKFDQDGRRINVVTLEEGVRDEMAREAAAKERREAMPVG